MTDNEKDLKLEKELKRFNWGAAYFGIIWALLNGCFKKWFINSLVVSLIILVIGLGLIFIPSFFVPGFSIMAGFFGGIAIPILMLVVVFIYVGLKGNRWAWEGDKYDNIEHFNKIQKRWAIVAGVLLSLSAISMILQFGALYMLTKLPAPEPEEVYISRQTCQIVYDRLPYAISKVNINDEAWVSKIADVIAEDENIFGYGLDYTKKISVSVFDKNTADTGRGEFDVVLDPPCSISEANCYISAKTADENAACRFYFDNSGEVAMSQKTKTFLQTKDKTPKKNTEIPDYLKKDKK